MNTSSSPHARRRVPPEDAAMTGSHRALDTPDHRSAALPLLDRTPHSLHPVGLNGGRKGGGGGRVSGGGEEEEDYFDDSAYFLTPSSDLESPGTFSQSGKSIGEQSSVSDRSTHSRAALLRGGDAERDVIIEQRMEADELDEEANACRIWRFSPACFQMCANVKMFVFFMCVLLVVASALTTGYLNSVITTIEKRFEIGSSISGLIAAAYEFGNLVAVIFVSYLGASRHIPKWIGFGVIVMGVGSLLFSLPHVIAPKYTVRSGMSENETGEENICRAPPGVAQHYGGEMCIEENSGNWVYVLLLVAAQV